MSASQIGGEDHVASDEWSLLTGTTTNECSARLGLDTADDDPVATADGAVEKRSGGHDGSHRNAGDEADVEGHDCSPLLVSK